MILNYGKMKRTIRSSVFETNSSSTHSMIIATDEEVKLLNSGELLIQYNELITKEEAIEEFNKIKENNPTLLHDDDYKNYLNLKTLDEFINEDEHYEYYDYNYTTKGGEHLNIYVRYGTDY